MELKGDRFGAQESVSKCLHVQVSGQMGCGGVGAFYSPPRETARWGVRDPDISGLGPDMSGTPLWNPTWELDMSSSEALTRDKAESPDMSEKPL
jgi:hypothetical protein